MDYLLTHRVLISTKQRRGYFVASGGNLFGRFDESEDSVDFYTQAIANKPQDPNAYIGLARAHGRLGRYQEAIADYTRLIELKPDSGAYNSRAWSYHLAGRDAEGLPDAEKAVALTPTNSAAIETRAEIFEKLGRRDAAIADYRAALRIKPDMASAQAGLKRMGVAP